MSDEMRCEQCHGVNNHAPECLVGELSKLRAENERLAAEANREREDSIALGKRLATANAENERLTKQRDNLNAMLDEAEGPFGHYGDCGRHHRADGKCTMDCISEQRDEKLRDLRAALKACSEALADAKATLENTHANYCDAAWTDRGLHAPECLLADVADITRALAQAKAVMG